MNINKIKHILQKKEPGSTLALEISQGWIKAAVSQSSKDGLEITGLAAKEIKKDEPEEISTALNELLNELKLTDFRLIVSLPKHSVTTRYLSLPSRNPAELAEMAKLQAVKQLPYSKEELVIAHKILEEEPDGYSKVMLAVAHKAVVDKLIDTLAFNKMEPEFIALSSEAIGQYILLAGAVSAAESGHSVAVIDVDSAFTEVQVERSGKVIFSRSLHHGIRHFENTEHLANWIEEIKLSLHTYAKTENAAEIKEIILTGASWKRRDLDGILNKEIKIPVRLMQPLENIKIAKNAEEAFNSAGYLLSFSSIIALASAYSELKINLLPEPLMLIHERKAGYKTMVNIAILAACFVLIFGVFFCKKVHDKKVYLSVLQKKLEEIAPEAEELEKKAKIIRLVSEQEKQEGSCLDIIREVHAVTPSNIYLTKLMYEESKDVALKGSSANMSNIFKYVTALEDSKYFKNVKLRYASKRKKKDADVTDFEIFVSLR